MSNKGLDRVASALPLPLIVTLTHSCTFKYKTHPDGLRIGHINVGTVMVANDIDLLTNSTDGIQAPISVAECNSTERR